MKGEEDTLRRESMPMRLLLGERPAAAGADKGAAVLRVEERTVSKRLGVIIGLDRGVGAEIASFKMK